nr:MAG TPA: hypothetical protein [Caudoviricetes sp.]
MGINQMPGISQSCRFSCFWLYSFRGGYHNHEPAIRCRHRYHRY